MSGGELRSRLIRSPRGNEIRPTPGRVKEALFSILGDELVEARGRYWQLYRDWAEQAAA